MKLNKSKLLAIGISVVVASTTVGAANNYMAKDEPVEQPKTEKTVDKTSDKKTEEVKQMPAERIGDEPVKSVQAPEPTVQNLKPSQHASAPIVEYPEETKTTQIPVEYVDTPPVVVPVINTHRILLTEVTDYPNERYSDRKNQKCIHHMEDGTSRWMVSTIGATSGDLCLPSGTVMSQAQYIQFRTDEIPTQWR